MANEANETGASVLSTQDLREVTRYVGESTQDVWAIFERPHPAVVDVLKRYPAAPPGGGCIGELLRDLNAALWGRF